MNQILKLHVRIHLENYILRIFTEIYLTMLCSWHMITVMHAN